MTDNKRITNITHFLGSKAIVFSRATGKWRTELITHWLLHEICDGRREGYQAAYPILKPLTSMSYHDFALLFNRGGAMSENYMSDNISSFRNLHSFYQYVSKMGEFDTIDKLMGKGYDVLFMIARGLAVDATKKKSQWPLRNNGEIGVE